MAGMAPRGVWMFAVVVRTPHKKNGRLGKERWVYAMPSGRALVYWKKYKAEAAVEFCNSSPTEPGMVYSVRKMWMEGPDEEVEGEPDDQEASTHEAIEEILTEDEG